MASYPPKKSTQHIFYAPLVDRVTGLFKSSPTLAAGDFKVSIDGGALANLATLPTNTPASSTMVKFTLSTSEMAGDVITVVCIDAAGSEWNDTMFTIFTSTRQIDDLAYPTTSGRSIDVDASGGVEVGSIQADVITASAIAADAIGSSELAATAATEIADKVVATVLEGAHTLGDLLRLCASVLTGKSSGGGTTTVVFRDLGDTKNRISSTVDANGNRTSVGTRDGT